jgi:site-specific recombinase XerD
MYKSMPVYSKYRRLESQTINNMLNVFTKKAGYKKNIHPHASRHGRLMDLAMRVFN